MEERGMNERIKKLRKLSVDTQPHIDLERAKSMTKTYEKYEGVLSIPELRGQVLKDYFATMWTHSRTLIWNVQRV